MGRKRSRHKLKETRSSPFASLENWLGARRLYIVLAVVSVSLGLRGLCLLELRASPFFALHGWDHSDMNYFHSWARTIAAGDIWSQTVRPPLHEWHREIAADYAAAFPREWAKLTGAAPSDDDDAAARLLWNRWCGKGRFYQDPLYPYLIALTQKLLGPSAVWVFVWQILLGTASTVLVYFLTRRFFGDFAAVVAVVLALLFGPLMFYDFVLLRATLVTFAGLLLVLLLERARQGPGRQAWFWAGIACGLAMILKSHFVFMLAGGVGLGVGRYWKSWRAMGGAGGALAAGFLIGFGPVVVRNVVVGAPPLVTATGGGPTFVIANAEDARDTGLGFGHAARILAETDNSFLPTVIATLRTHPSVTSYLRLLGRRLLAIYHWFEAPNNSNFYYGQLHSRTLRSLPVSFGWIAPAACLGLVLGVRRFGRCPSLYLLAAGSLAVPLLFLAYSRFRLPLAVALLPFAGLAVAQIVEWLLVRRWGFALPTVAALAVLVVLALYPVGPVAPRRPFVRLMEVANGYRYYYDPQVRAAASQGNWTEAADVLARSLRAQPQAVRALSPTRHARTVKEAQLAGFYAHVYRGYAELLAKAGRTTQAEGQLARSVELLRAAGKGAPGRRPGPGAGSR